MSNRIKFISRHISYSEAVKSTLAIRLGIKNTPSLRQRTKMKLVAGNVFEPVRARFGGYPIGIVGFFRSKKLNKILNNSVEESHCRGEALDIDTDLIPNTPFTNADIFYFIKDYLEFDELVWEFGKPYNPDWVHVTYTKNNRRKVLMSIRKNTKKLYFPFNLTKLVHLLR